MNEGTDRGPRFATLCTGNSSKSRDIFLGHSMEWRSWRWCCHACTWCWPQILPMSVMLQWWCAMMWCAFATTSELCWCIVLLFYEATVETSSFSQLQQELLGTKSMLLRCRRLPQPRGSKFRAHGVWVWQLCWEAPATIGRASCDQRTTRSEQWAVWLGRCMLLHRFVASIIFSNRRVHPRPDSF